MKTRTFSSALSICIGIAGAALLSGCARETKSGAASAKSTATANPNVAKTNAAPQKVARAVFRVDENSRDPFFPQAKKVAAAVPGVEPKAVVTADVAELLRAGFQGIGLSGESRIAIINNVLLEPGKLVSVPVENGKREQRVSVRCREINRTSVILEVEGVAEPVVISREQKTQFEARR